MLKAFALPAVRLAAGRSASRSPMVRTPARAVHKIQETLRMSEKGDTEVDENVPDAMPETFKAAFLQTMKDRGFIHQCTDFKSLDDKFTSDVVSAYLGFDATASSLHVGSLLQIMILRTLQKTGHKPIILIGGGTTKVGDPTGKDESRQLLTEEIIQSNADSISKVFEKFIKFGDGPTDAIMVNNADWLDDIKYLEFLRDYGRFFTVNRMLSFESVKQRLSREQPFSFLEFNYILLQAYDFLELSRRHNAVLQLGGSDQWGNMISGVELARKVDQRQLFAMTAPLITKSDGTKMGKTAGGAIWLNKDQLSEFEYWQFWRNTADADVIRFLKLFTEVPLEQIREMEKWTGAELNQAKVVLADEATKMLHGEACLESIRVTAQSLFGNKGGGDLDSLQSYEIDGPSDAGVPVVELLLKASFASSKAEARRLIKGGGARVNNEKVTDEAATVKTDDFDDKGRLKLSSGKKNHCVITIS